MAPRKRSLTVEEEDEHDSDIDRMSETLPRSAQSSTRKRRRTGDDPSVHEEVSSDVERQASPDTPPSDYEDEDNIDTEENALAATQALREMHERSKGRVNEPTEHGILEKVELTNFMCHADMKYDLGPLINFITGKNGSGKSAILTAITVCLGGKASSTNRGGKLQDFIKEGKDYASITCRIKNQGEGAYMPEEYGDSILVERHFSRLGGSGFKLKSKSGRIISTKRSDLDDICDHYSLQIDNPMNVLSQDQARQFITTASPAEKYELFIKGTQLEQLDQDYQLIEEQVDNIEAKLEAKKPDLKILEQRMERAKTKLTLIERHDGIRDKIADYRRQLAWVQIQHQESVRDGYISAVDSADEKIAEAERQATTVDDAFQRCSQEAVEAQQMFNTAQTDVQALSDEKKEAKVKFDEAKLEVSDAQNEQRTIRTTLQDLRKKITQKTQEIEEEKTRLAELDGGGAARRLAQLELAKEAFKEAKQEFIDHSASKPRLEEEFKKLKEKEGGLDENVKTKQREVEQQKKNLDNLKQKDNAQDRAFDDNMPQLLDAIRRETRFQQQPIGPIGKHIKLLKPEWSSILERSFGGFLNGFIVTSKRDEVLLSELMRRCRCNVSISIGNNQPIDTTPHEPDQQYQTVLRVLEIDNEMVKKQLVIQTAIEQTILIPDLTEASRVLFGGNEPIRNVKRCYSFDPNDHRRGFVLFYRQGRAAQDPVHPYPKVRMKTDIDMRVRMQNEALTRYQNQLFDLEQEYRSTRERRVQAAQDLKKHGQRNATLRIDFQKAEDEVEAIKDAIQNDNVESGKLEVLRNALTQAQGEKDLNEETYIDATNAYEEKRNIFKQTESVLKSFDVRLNALQEQADKLQRTAQELDKKRAHALGEKNTAYARIDDARRDREAIKQKKLEMDEKLNLWTEQARQVSERVNIDAGETRDSLEKKYNRLKADYNKSQQQIGGTRDDIATNAAQTSEAYKKGLRDFRLLEVLSHKLKDSLMERKRRWEGFRGSISVRAKSQFTYTLSERGFRGTIRTDHRKKLLDLRVEPDITKHDGKGRGAKTLSGGEKSFAQICLLLSLWEAMGSPIRCLDEFDVYMDAVNRNMSVNLLIDGARTSRGKQFILISPGTKMDIEHAPDIKVTEIEPPLRGGQTRLVIASA